MLPICIMYSEVVTDSRLKYIAQMLAAGLDRQKMVDAEVDNDIFIHEFIHRMEHKCPDARFVSDRLKLAKAEAE
ncbi:MAG: hypothetical protein LUQ40_04330 [Methanomicrobiales archaeon]|nr:hypothetical protein [Methanomicrobiales archaeon]